jgi:hypothetical protein
MSANLETRHDAAIYNDTVLLVPGVVPLTGKELWGVVVVNTQMDAPNITPVKSSASDSYKAALKQARYELAVRTGMHAYIVQRTEDFKLTLYAYVQPRLRANPGETVLICEVPHGSYVTDGRYFWQVVSHRSATGEKSSVYGELPVLKVIRPCPPIPGVPVIHDREAGFAAWPPPDVLFVYVGATEQDVIAAENAALMAPESMRSHFQRTVARNGVPG